MSILPSNGLWIYLPNILIRYVLYKTQEILRNFARYHINAAVNVNYWVHMNIGKTSEIKGDCKYIVKMFEWEHEYFGSLICHVFLVWLKLAL